MRTAVRKTRWLAAGAMLCTVLTLRESSAAENEEAIGLPEDYNVVWTSQSKNSGESMPVGGGDIGLNGLPNAMARVRHYWKHDGCCFEEQSAITALPGSCQYGFVEGGRRSRSFSMMNITVIAANSLPARKRRRLMEWVVVGSFWIQQPLVSTALRPS